MRSNGSGSGCLLWASERAAVPRTGIAIVCCRSWRPSRPILHSSRCHPIDEDPFCRCGTFGSAAGRQGWSRGITRVIVFALALPLRRRWLAWRTHSSSPWAIGLAPLFWDISGCPPRNSPPFRQLWPAPLPPPQSWELARVAPCGQGKNSVLFWRVCWHCIY